VKKTILLSAVACTLSAADPAIHGPRLGFVASKDGVRAVLGLVGSSRFSAPLPHDLHRPVALPNSDTLVGVDGSGKLALVDIADGTTKILAIENVTALYASPGGSAFAARSGDRLHVFSKDGASLADYALPGEPLRIAVADSNAAVAVTVATEGVEALYVIGATSASRAFQADRIAAVAFIAGSSDLLFADAEGMIYRLRSNLEMQRLGVVPGVKALAGDRVRALAIAGAKIDALPFDGAGATSIDCPCEATLAQPLGASKFLLVPPGNGPAWVLDASMPELRVAFIPQASNE
jgi:hypothetical protein